MSVGAREGKGQAEDTHTRHDREQRDELFELLVHGPILSSLDTASIAGFVDACDLLEVGGGTYLLRAGEPLDALYGVIHGGLRIIRCNNDGLEQTVREFYRGDTLGLLGMFVERPSPVDLVAIRDSTVVRLPRARFLLLAQKHPDLLQAFARLISEHAFDMLELIAGTPTPSSRVRGGNVALILISPGEAAREAMRRLIEMMLESTGARCVTARMLQEELGSGCGSGAGMASTDHGESGRLRQWLQHAERGASVVLYECESQQPDWTAACLRQADRVVIVAAADDGGRIDELAFTLAEAQPPGPRRQVDLVLVHPRNAALPSGTRLWSRLTDVRRLHHVRQDEPRDLQRVTRQLLGKSIGVALSGGGARGIAHVGVLAALSEAGIPIDYVCGTSMGSIFAAAAALGWSTERMRESVHDIFSTPFALYDVTLPISSILAGRKLNRVIHGLFGDTEIEDLWLPFFCVSTDLSCARLVVHDRGSLWKSVRASCSIPGIFPPQSLAGFTLADGGLMDNLPLDLLAERCPGSIIAVDVFPYGDPTFTRPAGMVTRWLRNLRTRIKGEPASPPLFDILMRSTLVGSKFRQQTAAARLKNVVHLEPPVASFGILQWRAHRALYEAGYRYAKEQIDRGMVPLA